MSIRASLASILRRAADRLDPPMPAARHELLSRIKAGFVRQNTTFSAWCKAHGIKRQNVTTAILIGSRGAKTQRLIQQIIEAAGLDNEVIKAHKTAV